jgi:hypothetical protein
MLYADDTRQHDIVVPTHHIPTTGTSSQIWLHRSPSAPIVEALFLQPMQLISVFPLVATLSHTIRLTTLTLGVSPAWRIGEL